MKDETYSITSILQTFSVCQSEEFLVDCWDIFVPSLKIEIVKEGSQLEFGKKQGIYVI